MCAERLVRINATLTEFVDRRQALDDVGDPLAEQVAVARHAQHAGDHVHGESGAELGHEIDRAVSREGVDERGCGLLDHLAVGRQPVADEVRRHDLAAHHVTMVIARNERGAKHLPRTQLVGGGRIGLVIGEHRRDIVVPGEPPDVTRCVVEERMLMTHPLPDGLGVAPIFVCGELGWIERH